MLKGFKDFILRGNVVELAVAVIIGTAFTNIVTALSKHLISPLIASFGGANISGFGFRIISSNDATFLDFGAVITAVINFIIIAAVVYFLVIVPMNTMNTYREKAKKTQALEEPETTQTADNTEIQLLTQIRDLLYETHHNSAKEEKK